MNLPLGVWTHWKGGQYEVTSVAAHANSAELFVVYRSCKEPLITWVRNIEDFLSDVEVFPGHVVPRFTYGSTSSIRTSRRSA